MTKVFSVAKIKIVEERKKSKVTTARAGVGGNMWGRWVNMCPVKAKKKDERKQKTCTLLKDVL